MSEERALSRRGFLRGVAGAGAVAGASGSAVAQGAPPPEEEGGDGGGEGGGTATGTADGTAQGTEDGGGGGGGSATVNLVDFAFEPGTEEPLYAAPGTTVTFVWETSTHNIVVDSQPEGANWEGHENIEDAGFEYEHTFEELGDYEFHCQPHINQGMEGTIVVNEQGAPPAPEGGGGPAIPDSAKTLGIAASVAMSATLGLAYAFLKYGGGREPSEPAD